MLLSPILSESGKTGRLEVIRLELRPPPGAIHSVRTMAHRFRITWLSSDPKRMLSPATAFRISRTLQTLTSGHLFPFPSSPTY
jgi:hypothetical protein